MSNKAVVYKSQYNILVEDIGDPKMEVNGKVIHHAVILQILASNICGTDLHIYRGRTETQPNMPIGHEITGMVIEKGVDVNFVEIGDIVSVPCNVACGRCQNCKAQETHICLNANDWHPGGAYGYPKMGPWQGGQAEYILIPYADFNLLKFPDPEQAKEKLIDLATLSDIFPTGFHAAHSARVQVGSTVYIAGAGPVGLCAAVSAYLLGAACVIIGDLNKERLVHCKQTLGCETIDLAEHEVIQEQIADILKVPYVDCVIDAIGYEAHGHGHLAYRESPTDALDTAIDVSKYGGHISVTGVYVSKDPYSATEEGKVGRPGFSFGRAWEKGLSFTTGITPVMKYNRQLMNAILFDRVKLSHVLNSTPIRLEYAPQAYKEYENGAVKKFIFDPTGVLVLKP